MEQVPTSPGERPQEPGASRPSWGEPLSEWAFAQSPFPLAIFDEDLRLVRANAGTKRALSRTEAELRGLRLPDITPDPVSDETERMMRRVLETGEPQYVDAPFVPLTGPGAEHGWATSLTPLRDPDGLVRAVSLAAHHTSGTGEDGRRPFAPDDDASAVARVGTTLDSARTAQELMDVAVPRLADFAVVDLLDPLPRGTEPSAVVVAGPVTVRRAAVRSVLPGNPESRVAVGERTVHPPQSPPAECLAAGRGAVYATADPSVARWVAQDPAAAWIAEYGAHSLMVVPLRAGAARSGWPSSAATGARSPSCRRTCGWPRSSRTRRRPASATRPGTTGSTPPR